MTPALVAAATQPALVAVAHGSRAAGGVAAVSALVEEVRRQRPGLSVTAAYLDHGRPRLAEAVAAAGPGAVVVPLLLTAAFHSRVDLPAQLASADPSAVQADVLGPHPLLVDALVRRLAEAGVSGSDDQTSVVLAAAGSADPEAQRAVSGVARALGAATGREVQPAYASAADPTVEKAVQRLRSQGARRIAVASYLLAPGLFADRLAAAGADVVSAPLAAAPEVAALVLERYDAARVRAAGQTGGLPRSLASRLLDPAEGAPR